MIHLLGAITVTTAGTRVQVSSTRITCAAFTVYALSGNSGTNIYVGDKGVSSAKFFTAVAKGTGFSFPALSDTNAYDLSTIWLDADTSGDKAQVSYITR